MFIKKSKKMGKKRFFCHGFFVMKSLKAHYKVTWRRTKLSKKRLDQNNNDNNKKDTNNLLSLNLREN